MTQPGHGRNPHSARHPVRRRRSVDLVTFEALGVRRIEAGIHGLVACGTTGEASTLETEEWASVVAAASGCPAGRVPVSAGVGTNKTRCDRPHVEVAAGLGADVDSSSSRTTTKPNAAGLRVHVAEAAAVGLPLMLYHVPGRTGQRLDHRCWPSSTAIPGSSGSKRRRETSGTAPISSSRPNGRCSRATTSRSSA